MTLRSINPATGATNGEYSEMSGQEVAAVLARADHAFRQWGKRSIPERAEPMRAAGRLLRERARQYARLMAEEMGKPITEGIAECDKCATTCDYYAENAERFLAPEIVATDGHGQRSFVAFQPLGVVVAIMPWNFPFWQVMRFAAPALMAGNGAVLKHSANVPGCAVAIESLLREAGFPENLFRTLMIGSDAVSGVIESPHVRAVTLTGSGTAGRAVARKAGEMLKKTVLELGGSDAYLVLEDADLELAATVSAKGRLINSGQSCIAAKRFVVVDSVRAEFERRLVEKMLAARVGDPMDERTQVGPMARHDLRNQLHKQVEDSIANGARCLCGGHIPNTPGAYYPPTVLTEVAIGMPAYEEELFGPVAAVIPVESEAGAIETANDSVFGLGGGVFTRDLERGARIAVEQMEAGSVFVNDAVRSDPKLPFGGVKESGYGRELSHFGIREFVNIKSILIADGYAAA
jgi:succinate-semialdehyde dehydrogenase/glutarate-semialdehyde dehydrogenase